MMSQQRRTMMKGPETTHVYPMYPSSSDPPGEDPYSVLRVTPILGLMHKLVDENQSLSEQQAVISSQMKELAYLSAYLLEQNKRMRSHYHHRTIDIYKLSQTVTINTDRQYSDISHRQHLLKQQNFALIRHIQSHIKFIERLGMSCQSIRKDKNETDQNTAMVQHETLVSIKARLNNNLSEPRIQQLTKDNAYLTAQCQQLQTEISGLLVNNYQYRKLNNTDLNNAIHGKDTNMVDKSTFKTQVLDLIRSVMANKREKEQMEGDLYRQGELNDALRGKFDKTKERMVELWRDKEKLATRLDGAVAKKEFLQKMLVGAFEGRNKAEVDKGKSENDRGEIIKQVADHRNHLTKEKAKYNQNQQEANQRNQDSIRKIQQAISQAQATAQQDIKKIKQEKDKLTQLATELQSEDKSLEEDIRNYQSTLEQLENPTLEIQRMNLRLEMPRQALREIK